jgi:hypothetical protein
MWRIVLRRSSQLTVPFIFFASMLACHTSSIAGTIRIETKTSVTVAGDILRVEVTTTNNGDAPAHNVQTHLLFLGDTQSGQIRDLLKQGEPETSVFANALAGLHKGRYPLTVLVDFHDANRYPFSAVSCTTFYFKEDVNPDLVCVGDEVSIQDSGALRFKIKNLGSTSRTIHATLVLPKEISSPMATMDFKIGAKQEKVATFRVNNLAALLGASYPVFCCFEYDSEETHYTAIAEALVAIEKRENWFLRTKHIWLGAAIILGAIIAVYQFKRKSP